MICLGLNVYHWGARQQDRLLVECLGPVVEECRQEGLVERFWFDRFDARGPHLFILLTLPGHDEGVEAGEDEVARRVEVRLTSYLTAHPSSEVLSSERLAQLQGDLRGKALCSEDLRPGVAANNSYVLFTHDPQGYPFRLSAGLPFETELWRLLDDLARWGIQQIAAHPPGPPLAVAVRWAAGLDAALRAAGLAEEYWRFHAMTLLLGLEERLAAEEDQVLGSLEGAVGEKNRATFSRLWAEHSPVPVWPHLSRLVALAAPEADASPAGRRFQLLRETVHCGWKQLGVPVPLHIPLVLFAWSQSSP